MTTKKDVPPHWPNRLCFGCDKWVPARETVCKACGLPTEKAQK